MSTLEQYKNKFKITLMSVLYHGIDVVKLDMQNATIYIDIPKDSFVFHGSNPNIKDPESYASFIKQLFIRAGFTNTNIKFRVKDMVLEEKDSQAYYNAHILELGAKIDNAFKIVGG